MSQTSPFAPIPKAYEMACYAPKDHEGREGYCLTRYTLQGYKCPSCGNRDRSFLMVIPVNADLNATTAKTLREMYHRVHAKSLLSPPESLPMESALDAATDRAARIARMAVSPEEFEAITTQHALQEAAEAGRKAKAEEDAKQQMPQAYDPGAFA